MENGQQKLKDVLIEQLRDLLSAEKQLAKALPKVARAAEASDLSACLLAHLTETNGQIARIEAAFELLGTAARAKHCKAMEGLLEESSEVIKEEDKGLLRDVALIAGAQRVEHYEISAYGTARAIAEVAGQPRVAKLLRETEDEESAADSKLTAVADAIYRQLLPARPEPGSRAAKTAKAAKG